MANSSAITSSRITFGNPMSDQTVRYYEHGEVKTMSQGDFCLEASRRFPNLPASEAQEKFNHLLDNTFQNQVNSKITISTESDTESKQEFQEHLEQIKPLLQDSEILNEVSEQLNLVSFRFNDLSKELNLLIQMIKNKKNNQ